MKLLIKMPTRSRPHKVVPLVADYIRLASRQGFDLVISVHADDKSMLNATVAQQLIDLRPAAAEKNISLKMVTHNGKTKVDAYNSDPQVTGWDIQVATSDDMVPRVQDYDQVIVQAMQQHFPDTDGILHFADGYQNSNLMTLPIIGRRYYDRFGYVYNPEYTSLWCDNEMTEVGKILGKYRYFPRMIIEHCHPIRSPGGTQNYDDQMRHTESFYAKDKAVFKRRQARQFDLRSVT